MFAHQSLWSGNRELQRAITLVHVHRRAIGYVAAQNGFDLDNSYGYGDSHADLVWLQLLGNPTAVNPDIQLYRHAQEKHWNVLDWKRRATSADDRSELPEESTTATEGVVQAS